jgi:hypothetical protein
MRLCATTLLALRANVGLKARPTNSINFIHGCTGRAEGMSFADGTQPVVMEMLLMDVRRLRPSSTYCCNGYNPHRYGSLPAQLIAHS